MRRVGVKLNQSREIVSDNKWNPQKEMKKFKNGKYESNIKLSKDCDILS